MPTFGQNFLQGFEVGRRARESREAAAREEEDRKLRQQALQLQLRAHKLDEAYRARGHAIDLAKMLEGTAGPRVQLPFMRSLGTPGPEVNVGHPAVGVPRVADPDTGQEILPAGSIQPRTSDEVLRAAIMQAREQASARADVEQAGMVPIGKVGVELGLDPGLRVSPDRLLTTAGGLAESREATRRHRERSGLPPRPSGPAGAGVDGESANRADYVADQVRTRRLKLSKLPAAEKRQVLESLQRRGLPLPRELSTVEEKAQGDAINALASLDRLEEMLAADDSLLWKKSLPSFVARAAGAGEYLAVEGEVTDVKSRLRTGAAITDFEQAFYRSQAPQPGDPQEIRQRKISHLRGFYLGLAGQPVVVRDPESGEAYEFDDLYDPKQRLGLRKAINAGAVIEY